MKVSRWLLVLVLFLLLSSVVFTGCGKKGEEPGPGPSGEVTTESIEAEAGKEFQVSLEANPSTGYEWAITGEPDSAIVESLGKEAASPGGGESMPGAPSKEVWKFKAVAEGRTEITFESRRSWEKDEPPAATHKVSVTVSATQSGAPEPAPAPEPSPSPSPSPGPAPAPDPTPAPTPDPTPTPDPCPD